jgi:hypothetical protein
VEFGEFYKFCEDRHRSQDFTLKNQQKPVPKKSYGIDDGFMTIFFRETKITISMPSRISEIIQMDCPLSPGALEVNLHCIQIKGCPVGLKEIFLEI